jgi:hypothetical protein
MARGYLIELAEFRPLRMAQSDDGRIFWTVDDEAAKRFDDADAAQAFAAAHIAGAVRIAKV